MPAPGSPLSATRQAPSPAFPEPWSFLVLEGKARTALAMIDCRQPALVGQIEWSLWARSGPPLLLTFH